jgi:hypothetical protein
VQAAWDAAWIFPFILLFPWTATSPSLRRWLTTSIVGGDSVMRPSSDDPGASMMEVELLLRVVVPP